ncbi:hypothetical protein GJAV_G00119360 [Gymnothorax javanicus]|nr:hypothetical protein GJAV_G00119360 [Gymnothorax javanicus]
MEEQKNLMEHMYGELGTGHLASPAIQDEDSVDIYSGLDSSPGSSQIAEKSCTRFSPRRLKDSLDLYEEMIKEEQQEKEATCSELKKKLDAAQNQVKELLQKLEEIQLQNASLLSQNTSLKKNICALFKTARMEILRKDNEISRLSQRGGRGGYCPSFSRPQNNYQRNLDSGQNCAPIPDRAAYTKTHRSKDTCVKGPPRPCSEAAGVSLQPVPRDNSLLTPPSCERSTRTETVVPSRLGEPAPAYSDRGSNIQQTLNLESLSGQTSTACPANEEKPKVCEKQPVPSQDHSGKSLGSKVGDQKEQCIALDSRKEAILSNGNKSGKEGNQSVKDGMNSSAFHVHKESKLQSRETSSKEGKRFEKDCIPSNGDRQQPSLSEPRRSLERGKSPPHLRKRSPLASSSHRTTSGSHSHKMRSKDMEQSTKSNSRESRHSHSRGGRDASRSLDREGKCSGYDRGKVSTSSSRKGSSPRREHHRKVERSHDERSRYRESRSSVTGKNKNYDRKKGKDSDKSLKDGKVDEKKDKILERNNDLNNGRKFTFAFSADSCDLVKDGEKLSKGQAKHLASVKAKVHVLDGEELLSCVEHEAGQKSLPEERNQNRKLSFMETLNLTLSPIKKPRLSSSGNKREMLQSEVSQGSPDEETSQFDIGEEYCVIDELENGNGTFKETDEVLEAPAVGTADICEGEKTKVLQSEHVLENAKKENSQDKEKSVAPAHICSTQTECNSESIVDRNIVFQGADSVSPATTADWTPKLALQPVECRDSHSMSKVVDGTAMAALPPETLNGATESLPKASKIPTILNTDNVHVCSSTSEDGNSMDCESSSVKPITIDSAVVCGENCSPDSGKNIQSTSPTAPHALRMDIVSQDASTSSPIDNHPSSRRVDGVPAVFTEAVSSSVSVELVSQSCDIVVPDVTENHAIPGTKPEKYAERPMTNHSLAGPHSALATKVSSTFRDEVVQSEQDLSGALQAAQDCCMSWPDSTKHEEWNNRVEPSISVPVSFDEDSMMMTLKNIQPFPEAISPLTSPVRPVKRSLPQSSENSQHVRSLDKDFSTSPGARNVDVDKENEKPQGSSSQFPHMDSNSTTTARSSRPEDDYELEEGEIVSGSEEDEPPAIPSPKVRKTHTSTSLKKTPSPKSPRLAKMQAQKKTALISQGLSGMKSKTSTTPNSSPNSKRPRTVLPHLLKTNPSCIAEVMDMLKSIQGQLRKKYMKFHKNFPKKSFSNIIDMCLCSFTDFVNTVNFNEFCTLESILKPKLIRIISVSMSKISNNGIVNRIFEQQSPSLKKKLWAFVEDQFQFLFREIQATLTSVCKLPEARNLSKTECKERKGGNKVCKRPALPPLTAEATQKRKAAEVDVGAVSGVLSKVKPPTITPLRTGLGSRGKDLRTNKGEDKLPSEAQHSGSFHSSSKTVLTPPKNASSREKPAAYVRSLSQNGSVQDKSDFELLTEQQASSLTFNLVRDSQMGEIFKCLLQGSDLLENSVSVGDAHSWPVGTPLKCSSGGESSLAVMTPKKTTLTPSKLIATWSTISPCKLPSPNPKIHIPLNPAVLDESCMLEVPSSSLPFCKGTPSSSVPSQMSYSVLAEDLAVSLTIPSPLKSDGHLSFLCPESTEPTSAPESVISAHYSEDALLDGEDATEQDIHLALDSDNSSAGSSGCKTSEEPAMPTFQFKPHLPMQAVVMEKSNDHFIVRIRHMSTSLAASTDQNLTQDSEKEPQKVIEAEQVSTDSAHSTPCASPNENDPAQSQSPPARANPDLHPPTKVCLKDSLSGSSPPEKTVNCYNANAAHSNGDSVDSAPTNSVISESASLSDLVIVTEEDGASKKSGETGKKRKKRHSERRAKRVKSEHTQEVRKLRKKSSSAGSKHMGVVTPNKERKKSPKLPPLSPNSLSAKNVIRRKGEVVVTWTRDEDRDILVELKMKGPSPDTFSALSSKIKKPPALIAERFTQLMKLFKKKERMAS